MIPKLRAGNASRLPGVRLPIEGNLNRVLAMRADDHLRSGFIIHTPAATPAHVLTREEKPSRVEEPARAHLLNAIVYSIKGRRRPLCWGDWSERGRGISDANADHSSHHIIWHVHSFRQRLQCFRRCPRPSTPRIPSAEWRHFGTGLSSKGACRRPMVQQRCDSRWMSYRRCYPTSTDM